MPFVDDMFKNEMLQRRHHVFIFLIGNTYLFEHILGYIRNRYWRSDTSGFEITNPNDKRVIPFLTSPTHMNCYSLAF